MTAVAVAAPRPDESAQTLPPLQELVDFSGLRTVVVGVSKDPNAKVTVLLVSPTGGPELVVKAPTTPAAASAVERERDLLAEVRDLLPELLRATVPSPLGLVEHGGLAAMVTTAVPGTPMAASYLRGRHTARRRCVTDDFQAALDWLAELHRATAAAAAPIDLVTGLAAHLWRRFPDCEGQDALTARLEEIDSRLAAASTPRTAVHGDHWFGNLLVSGGGVSGVVDWEAGSASGEPVRDLARFALSYALYLDRRTRPGRRVRGHRGLRAGGWGAPVAFALEGTGWFPQLFRGFLEAGLVRLGAPAALWRDVALGGIAELALRSDNDDFARAHLDLFHRLTTQPTKGIPK